MKRLVLVLVLLLRNYYYYYYKEMIIAPIVPHAPSLRIGWGSMQSPILPAALARKK
jgi:hypothetical protein